MQVKITEMEVKISEKEAKLMAQDLNRAGFDLYGIGNFDLTLDEEVKIIMALFNKSGVERFQKLKELYERFRQKI